MLCRATAPGCWRVVTGAGTGKLYSLLSSRKLHRVYIKCVRVRVCVKESVISLIYKTKQCRLSLPSGLLGEIFEKRHCSELNEAVAAWGRDTYTSLRLTVPPLMVCTHTHIRTLSRTHPLTDTMVCFPTSPITGLFIRVSYRQYWQPADTQSLWHTNTRSNTERQRNGGEERKISIIDPFWLRRPVRKTGEDPELEGKDRKERLLRLFTHPEPHNHTHTDVPTQCALASDVTLMLHMCPVLMAHKGTRLSAT